VLRNGRCRRRRSLLWNIRIINKIEFNIDSSPTHA
jgi:hypothetical protein